MIRLASKATFVGRIGRGNCRGRVGLRAHQPPYARHLKILGERPGGALRNDATAKALLRWAATEREAWLEAVTNNPLLPGRILPSDYLRQQAPVAACEGRRRVEVLRDASRQLRTFKPE